MISLIILRIVNELNPPAVATPKCLTLNRPQPSSSLGLKAGPSTIIEVTAVPWKRSSVVIVMFGSTILCETTQL